MPVKEDLVRDGWTEAFRDIFGELRQYRPSGWRLLLWSLGWAFSSARKERGIKQYLTDKAMVEMGLQEKMEMADFAKMEKVRARADSVVDNSETAESLKPYYRQFCKRPCFHDEYLRAFNNPNVTLVDTDGQGVEAFTGRVSLPMVKSMRSTALCLLQASKWARLLASSWLFHHWGDGLTISENGLMVWRPSTVCIREVSPTPSFLGLNNRASPQLILSRLMRMRCRPPTFWASSRSVALDALMPQRRRRAPGSIPLSVWRGRPKSSRSCTPGYYNNEGHVEFESQNTFYGGGPIEFFNLMAKWREAGDLKGLEIS